MDRHQLNIMKHNEIAKILRTKLKTSARIGDVIEEKGMYNDTSLYNLSKGLERITEEIKEFDTLSTIHKDGVLTVTLTFSTNL